MLVAFVPSHGDSGAVVLMSCDPRHDPGRPIEKLAPAVIAWLGIKLGEVTVGACWAVIDHHGRFIEVALACQKIYAFNTLEAPFVEFHRFPHGATIDAYYQDVGVPGEVAVELLSAILEIPSSVTESLTTQAFLDAVELCGTLPAPSVIFKKVSAAAENGDARLVANAVQSDPVISASLINAANAARFAASGKTASVPQAVTRLGTSFVSRVVFIAEMMSRYKQGVCPGFDYHAYWLNAIATGAAMRGLIEEYEIPRRMADDAFTTGLVAGIGWLAVAETFPALMARYLERSHGADPITKARVQREIFPSEINRVSARYLRRFDFPEHIHATVAGRMDVERKWHDCLARAIRVGQAMAPFDCLAIPTTIPAPQNCQEEWRLWRSFIDEAASACKPKVELALVELDSPKTRYMDWL